MIVLAERMSPTNRSVIRTLRARTAHKRVRMRIMKLSYV
jgi:hypothetical protein